MALTDATRFVVSQKAKLIELTNEYAILDEQGAQIGAIRQEGQSALKKLARFVSSIDQFLTHTLAIYDADGSKVVQLVRPRKIMKSRFVVTDGQEQPVGEILQENLVGKKRFGLLGPAGEPLGSFQGESWVSWDFRILDANGAEVGRVNKKWAGFGKEMFTSADNYVVEIDPSVTGPLRLLAIAAASSIDTALKQDSA